MSKDTVSQAGPSGRTTWIGICIALFSLPLIRLAIRTVSHDPATGLVIVREVLYFGSAIALLVLVKRGEKLPLKSIGLGTSIWWKSALWGLVTMLLCGGAAELLGLVTKGSGTPSAFVRLPLWVCVLIVFASGRRGGIVLSRLCYRTPAGDGSRSLLLPRASSFCICSRSSRWSLGRRGAAAGVGRHSLQDSICGGTTWWPTSLPTP